MTTKVRASTLDLPYTPGGSGSFGGPLSLVASASTVVLSSLFTTTQNIAFTGTTDIGGFQIANGQTFICKFLGSFKLLASVALVTPGNINIQTHAGDSCIIRATADNTVEILCYTKWMEGNVTTPAGCYLSKSGANLLLARDFGATMPINGSDELIPAAGIQLAPTGLTPATNYYVYAYMNGGTMTLEASTTGHSKDANTGVEIKTGDATRSLVGFVRVVTGPAFQDDTNNLFVLSYYNRRSKARKRGISVPVPYGSPTFVNLNGGFTYNFLCWSNSYQKFSVDARLSNSLAGGLAVSQLLLDGTTQLGINGVSGFAAANSDVSYYGEVTANLSEGLHFIELFGSSQLGATTWLSTGGSSQSTLTGIEIQG
jgi:hypothetical protein